MAIEPTAYKEPTPWKEVGDVTMTSVGGDMELVSKTAMLPEYDENGKPTGKITEQFNPEYHRKSNMGPRLFFKNNVPVRILYEVDGVVDKANPLVSITAKCGLTERQALFGQFRLEVPVANAPIDPSIENAEIG